MLPIDSYEAVAREQIRFIQERMLVTARWAESSGVDAAAAELLLRPYRRLLDEMYQRDLPLARQADASDRPEDAPAADVRLCVDEIERSE